MLIAIPPVTGVVPFYPGLARGPTSLRGEDEPPLAGEQRLHLVRRNGTSEQVALTQVAAQLA
jgi:hypothetical protein